MNSILNLYKGNKLYQTLQMDYVIVQKYIHINTFSHSMETLFSLNRRVIFTAQLAFSKIGANLLTTCFRECLWFFSQLYQVNIKSVLSQYQVQC